MGRQERLAGQSFENAIERSFEGYAKLGKAYLDFMPVPTRMVRGPMGRPMLIQHGKAPFDVYGHAPKKIRIGDNDNASMLAVFVGAELKTTKDHETALSIVHPDSDSHGLEYHQLQALDLVAKCGGIARIVWDNGGQIGILDEQGIIVAQAIYEQSLESERRGKGKGPRGSRSIPWGNFKVVDYANVGGAVCIDWLKVGAA